jgi:hypothetical protein
MAEPTSWEPLSATPQNDSRPKKEQWARWSGWGWIVETASTVNLYADLVKLIARVICGLEVLPVMG